MDQHREPRSTRPTKTLPRILGLFVLFSAIIAQAQDLSVPDPGLNAAIRDVLQKPTGPLTTQDLLSLTNLSAAGRRINSLEGLDAAYNLTMLDLYHNYLTNVTLLDGLTNLTILNVGGNELTSFAFPSAFTNLRSLRLPLNLLTNFTLPAGLTNLA